MTTTVRSLKICIGNYMVLEVLMKNTSKSSSLSFQHLSSCLRRATDWNATWWSTFGECPNEPPPTISVIPHPPTISVIPHPPKHSKAMPHHRNDKADARFQMVSGTEAKEP